MSEQYLTLETLSREDVPAAQHLREQSGWNQTAQDWERVISLSPGGCFSAFWDGNLVGTVTTLPYGRDLGWIGMMLVDPRYRRRGIAKQLMRRALDHLEELGIASVKLDATPQGRPVYESFGFTPELLIERWEGCARPGAEADCETLGDARCVHRARVHALDRLAFGADRGRLLDSLVTDSDGRAIVMISEDGGIDAYGLSRNGSNAFYLGPIVARNESAAVKVLDAMLGHVPPGKVYIDINTGFGLDRDTLARRGFTRQRELSRMTYGEPTAAGTSGLVLGIAGPELG